MNDILNDDLNSVFVSNHRQYQGQALAPYTEGSRLLMLQVRDDNDSSIYFIWAFLFLHIELAKNKRNAIKLAWDRDGFREAVMTWVENKNEKDRTEATNLVASIIEESQKGQVESTESGSSGGNA